MQGLERSLVFIVKEGRDVLIEISQWINFLIMLFIPVYLTWAGNAVVIFVLS